MAKHSWRLSNADKAEIVRRYLAGHKVRDIAATYGLAVGYPSQIVRRRGVTLRRTRRSPKQLAAA